MQEISTECCCSTTYVEETILLSPGGQNPHRFTEHSAQGLVHTITYSTPETRFSELQFSEILDLMNKLELPFTYFTLYSNTI